MIEFIYNNIKHNSTDMLFFKVLYIYNSDLHFNIKNNISEKKTLTVQEQVKKYTRLENF